MHACVCACLRARVSTTSSYHPPLHSFVLELKPSLLLLFLLFLRLIVLVFPLSLYSLSLSLSACLSLTLLMSLPLSVALPRSRSLNHSRAISPVPPLLFYLPLSVAPHLVLSLALSHTTGPAAAYGRVSNSLRRGILPTLHVQRHVCVCVCVCVCMRHACAQHACLIFVRFAYSCKCVCNVHV